MSKKTYSLKDLYPTNNPEPLTKTPLKPSNNEDVAITINTTGKEQEGGVVLFDNRRPIEPKKIVIITLWAEKKE